MDRRKRSGVASVERLEKIKGFPAPHFAQDDPIGPVAKGRPQEIPDRDRRQAGMIATGFEAHQVGLVDLDLGPVFDENQSTGSGDKGRQRALST